MCVRGADAQFVASLDASAARSTYDGYLPSSVLTLAPAVLFTQRDVRLGLDGAFSHFESGRGSAQVESNAAIGGPIAGALHWDVGADGSGSWYRKFEPIFSGMVEPHMRLDLAKGGAWVGAGGGGTSGDSVGGHGVVRGEGGIWGRVPFLTASLSLANTAAGAVGYTDIEAVFRGDRGRFAGTVTAGVRSNVRLGGVGQWVNAEGRFGVVDGIALIAGWGAYPPDLVRGTPGARFITFGVRASHPTRTLGARERPPAAPSVLHDRQTVRFTAPAGSHVELMADFTDWHAVDMREVGLGVYEATVTSPLTSGTHRVDIRINAGPWIAPAELPPVHDDFGGEAGALVVP